MPQDNPNPKGSLLKNFFSKESKVLTYRNFNLDIFREFKTKMENFRRNAHNEQMEELWKTLEASYIPNLKNDKELKAFADTEISPSGEIVASRLHTDTDALEEFKEPLVAVKIHTALSILTQRTPGVKWNSDSDVYAQRVEVLDALRKNDWKDEQTRSQYTMLWFYLILFGTSYWRRYYVKEQREVKYASSIDLSTDKTTYKKGTITDFDQTTAEALSPLEVWIDPATCPGKPRSMRYVKYDKVYDYQQFVKLFKDVANKKDFDKVMPTSIEGREGDDLVKCEYFEHLDLDLFYVVANDQPILKSRLPNNHKQLSIRQTIWMPRNSKSPFGLGPIELMSPTKDNLEEFLSLTMNQTKFSIFKAAFYQGSLNINGGGDADEIRVRPDRMYSASDPKSITFMDVPGPGADSWRALDMFRARIDEASGINRPLGGEITKSTAFEIDLAKDAALSRLGVPISNIVNTLIWDAEIMFELQKQYYTLPDVVEMVDPDEIEQAVEELIRLKSAPGDKATFDIWVDESNAQDPRVFRGNYRVETLMQESDSEETNLSAKSAVITPEVFDWKGKIHVIADSILQITPTLERTKKMEFYNLILPLFQQPPELVAKTARQFAKLYDVSYRDIFPDLWLQYLKQVDSQKAPPVTYEELLQRFERAKQLPQPGPQTQQLGPDRVVTNVGGQRSAQASASQNNSPAV